MIAILLLVLLLVLAFLLLRSGSFVPVPSFRFLRSGSFVPVPSPGSRLKVVVPGPGRLGQKSFVVKKFQKKYSAPVSSELEPKYLTKFHNFYPSEVMKKIRHRNLSGGPPLTPGNLPGLPRSDPKSTPKLACLSVLRLQSRLSFSFVILSYPQIS